MIPEHLIPVPLLTRQQKKPVPIVEPRPPVWYRFPWQMIRLFIWLLRLRIRQFLRQPIDEYFADQLRAMFDEMGGFWVKIGQLISLRNDVLPPALCKQLAQLQYQVVGFPMAIVREAIEFELGKPLEEVFDVFDEQPIAAASIAQIHRARLRREQTIVAVKVSRPDIARNFGRDMRMFRLLIELLRRIPSVSHFGWEPMYWEMEQIFQEEVDYRYEAANMRRIAKNLRRHRVYVPEVYDDYSGQRVLVMEWVAGVLMSDFLAVARTNPDRLERWKAENNVDNELVGERLFLTFLRQLFEDNLFHADMHPGNIIILRDSYIALIDLGSIGSLDAQFLTNYQQSLRACGERDFARAIDYLFLLAEQWPRNVDQIKARVTRNFQNWAERAAIKSLPYGQRSIWSLGLETGQTLARDNVVLSWQFMKINRTWSTLDGSLAFLIQDVDYVRLLGRYFRGAQQRLRRAVSRIDSEDVTNLLQEATGMAALGESLLQQEMRVFQNKINTVSGSFLIGFRAFSRIALVCGLLAVYVLFYRHTTYLPVILRVEAIEVPLRYLPGFTAYHLFGIALLAFLLYRMFGQMGRHMINEGSA